MYIVTPINCFPGTSASHFIRKMRGGAQAHLIGAEDERTYVVKFQNNPQHRRILINELLATEVGRQIGLAMPPYSIVTLSSEFLAHHPDVHVCLEKGNQPVAVGPHFGSCFPVDPQTTAVYDIVPDRMLAACVINPEQFTGTLVFDCWLGNTDSRQFVFCRMPFPLWTAKKGRPRRGLAAIPIDHGHVFNGPGWNFPDSSITGLYHRRTVYQSVTCLGDLEPWLSRVRNFDEGLLLSLLEKIPDEWIDSDRHALARLLEVLLSRRSRIADIVIDCCKAGGLFPS